MHESRESFCYPSIQIDQCFPFRSLRDISNKGIRPINDFFEKIATLLTGVERGNNVQRDSIVGKTKIIFYNLPSTCYFLTSSF